MKFIIYSLSLFIAASLSGCTTSRPNPPMLNASPSNKVTISGLKYPELNLRFALHFRTLNKTCRYRPITITPLIDQKIYEVHLVPKGQTHFKVELYLDKYISEKCRWTPEKISFSTNDITKTKFEGRWRPLVNISKSKGNSSITALEINQICRMSNHSKSQNCFIKDKAKRHKKWPAISPNGADIKLIFEFDKI